LERVWVEAPICFVTCCVADRRPVLHDGAAAAILHEVWDHCETLHGWRVGAYVIMPDHVHFFCAASPQAKSLSVFVGKWKEWTAKYLHRRHQHPAPLWQPQFFNHLLRSEESYTEKWHYVRNNPVRAGLVKEAEAWPHWGARHAL
jgi:putative transposase